MTVPIAELLQRLSAALRSDIAPAINEEYPRTQAFMASVILERLSKEVDRAPAHAAGAESDLDGLVVDLEPILSGAPEAVESAFAALSAEPTVAALGPLIEALYDWGAAEPATVRALASIRPVLRRDIDRRMEIAT